MYINPELFLNEKKNINFHFEENRVSAPNTPQFLKGTIGPVLIQGRKRQWLEIQGVGVGQTLLS